MVYFPVLFLLLIQYDFGNTMWVNKQISFVMQWMWDHFAHTFNKKWNGFTPGHSCILFIVLIYIICVLPYWVTMTEVQSRYDLSEELSCLFRSQSALLHQIVKQLSTRNMLQYQIPAWMWRKCCKKGQMTSRKNNVFWVKPIRIHVKGF